MKLNALQKYRMDLKEEVIRSALVRYAKKSP